MQISRVRFCGNPNIVTCTGHVKETEAAALIVRILSVASCERQQNSSRRSVHSRSVRSAHRVA